MTNQEIVNTYKGILKIAGYKGPDFNWAVGKNKKRLKVEFDAVAEEETRIAGIAKAYEDDRLKICKELATKDEHGKPVIISDGVNVAYYDMTAENSEELDRQTDELKKKHKRILDERDAEQLKFKEFLKAENKDFVPYWMERKDFPKELLTEHTDILMDLVKESVEEEKKAKKK